MIKKIILLILLVILGALSVVLYNQFRMLPDRSVTETRDLERLAEGAQTQEMEKTPLPPADQPVTPRQPRKPELQVEAKTEPQAEEQLRDEQGVAPAQPVETSPSDESDQAGEQPKDELKDPAALGNAEKARELALDGRPGPSKSFMEDVDERPDQETKAEKILDKVENWAKKQVDKVENAVKDEEQEMETEQKVVREMKLTRQDEVLPETRVDKLVRQIEEKALGEVKTDASIREPIVKPERVYELESEPSGENESSRQPGQLNQVVSIELVLEKGEAQLVIHTASPMEQHKVFQMLGPRRLVIDLFGTFRRSRPRLQVPDNQLIHDVRTGLHPDKLRIVADMHPDAAVAVSAKQSSPTRLVVVLRPKD